MDVGKMCPRVGSNVLPGGGVKCALGFFWGEGKGAHLTPTPRAHLTPPPGHIFPTCTFAPLLENPEI